MYIDAFLLSLIIHLAVQKVPPPCPVLVYHFIEHEFTAAAAKRMTHLNIILRILTLRYIISYIWII